MTADRYDPAEDQEPWPVWLVPDAQPEAPRLGFSVTTADQLRATLPALPPARIEGVLPGRGGAVVIAQAGVGKTTMLANLARDLLEGTPFLGTQPVRPIKGRVCLMSYEMDAGQLIEWCEAVDVDLARLVLLDLRDVPNPLRDVYERQVLGEALANLEVEVVMVDTFGRAFTGDSQDSAGDVAAWFAVLNQFVRGQAGASEWIVLAHAGWVNGRARGSSALHDNPDAVLVYERNAETDERTLRVDKFRGRDPMGKVTVTMDPSSMRLYSDAVGTLDIRQQIIRYVDTHPNCSTNEIVKAVNARRADVIGVVRQLVAEGFMETYSGPNRTTQHRASSGSRSGSQIPGTTTGTTHEWFPSGSGVGSEESIHAQQVVPDPQESSGSRPLIGGGTGTTRCDECDEAIDDHLPGCTRWVQ